MVIIGFDPGLTNTGYAVLRKKNNEITMVECGLISPKKGKEVSERFLILKRILGNILDSEKIIRKKHLLSYLSQLFPYLIRDRGII